jgi:tetratricopeptide (TPR) repeat protein
MLSEKFRTAKALRAGGQEAAAVSLIQSSAIASDEDAFEAIVCCFATGNVGEARRIRAGHRWAAQWAARSSEAIVEAMMQGDRGKALAAAEAAIRTGQANFDATAVYLMVLKQCGRVDDAYAYILEHLQDSPSRETLLHTVISDVAAAKGDWALARSAALIASAGNPNNFRALLVLSFAAHRADRLQEALGYAMRADRLAPESPAVAFQLMSCLNGVGDHYGAIAVFQRLQSAGNVGPQIYDQLGAAFHGLGRYDEAFNACDQSLRLGSRSIVAIRGILRLALETGRNKGVERLVAQYEHEVEGDAESLLLLGLIALSAGDRNRAYDILSRSTASTMNQAGGIHLLDWPVSEPRIRHDYEQLELLERRGKLGESGASALSVLKRYYGLTGDPGKAFAPEGEEAASLKRALIPYHNKPDVPFAGRALGENDYRRLQDQYRDTRPSVIVIDNFLAAEALATLRQFCEEATVWKVAYKNGYHGALLSTGFCPRVLLAIADELRRAMPDVVGPHPLCQAWGFKYDQRMQGISLHADFARVNVNFWITPDSACDDHEVGGMVIYDVAAPQSWGFQDYNSADNGKITAFLQTNGARATRVPYRENRCVLFDSSLFHVTDTLRFKPGYTNRRVNVTLLYGIGLSTG